MSVFIYPPIQTSVSSAPIEYVLDGVNTQVSQDTGTPANSTGLPVVVLNPAGGLTDFATEAKQDTQITEAQATNTKLDTLNATDFATETTLAALEAKVLTDIELRASPVPVSGPLTDSELRASAVPVSGPLTDAELRATAVPVLGPLTDSELRATPVPVSFSSTPLPSGAATEAKQDTQITEAQASNTKLDTIIAKDFATSAKQDAEAALIGAVNETAPANDTASSGLNGRLQRIAQRITSLIALLPSTIGQKTKADSLSVTLASDQEGIGRQTQSGTITNDQVAVGLTAVRATVSGSAPSATRKKLMIKPSTSNSGLIYIGASSVTTSNGMQIIGPDRLEFEFDSSDYYLISDTAAQTVEIIEVA
jgi:hypothetical protein